MSMTSSSYASEPGPKVDETQRKKERIKIEKSKEDI